MATKFKVWIDTPSSGTNVQSDSDYSNDSKRINGFIAGDTISSIKVNSALRSSSLITTALMDALLPDSNLGLASALNDIKTALAGVIATKSDIQTLTDRIDTIDPSGSTTIADLQSDIDDIMSGAKIVAQAYTASSAGNATTANSATRANSDESGNNIKSSYASSLTLSNGVLTLKNKNNGTLSSVSLPTSSLSGTIGNSTTPVWLNNGTITKMSVGSSGNLYSTDGSKGKWISASGIRPDRMNNNSWINFGTVSTSSSLSPSETFENGLYAFKITLNSTIVFSSVAYMLSGVINEIAERTDIYTSIFVDKIVRETSGTIKVTTIGSGGSGIRSYKIEAKRLT